LKLIKNFFILTHLAWLWLFLVGLHLFLTNHLAEDNFLLITMNHVVFFCSFLVYTVSSHLQDGKELMWAFFAQFSFWLVISLVNTYFITQVKKYANRH